MDLREQQAFVDAYERNVSDVPRERVISFVKRFVNREEIEYSEDYTSIMDALTMWNEAIMYQLSKGANHA